MLHNEALSVAKKGSPTLPSQQHVLGTSLLLAPCTRGQLDPWSNLDEKQPGWWRGRKKALLSCKIIFLMKHLAWLHKYWGMCKTGERNTHLRDGVGSGTDHGSIERTRVGVGSCLQGLRLPTLPGWPQRDWENATHGPTDRLEQKSVMLPRQSAHRRQPGLQMS